MFNNICPEDAGTAFFFNGNHCFSYIEFLQKQKEIIKINRNNEILRGKCPSIAKFYRAGSMQASEEHSLDLQCSVWTHISMGKVFELINYIKTQNFTNVFPT